MSKPEETKWNRKETLHEPPKKKLNQTWKNFMEKLNETLNKTRNETPKKHHMKIEKTNKGHLKWKPTKKP